MGERGETIKQFNLQEILKPTGIVPKEYRELIVGEEGRDPGARFIDGDYSSFWLYGGARENQEIAAFFGKKLNGQVLVDLGAGYGEMVAVAEKGGARVYVKVDRGFYGRQKGNSPGEVQNRRMIGQTEEVAVRADMLEFVARLKSGAVNITINGIDEDIIESERYHAALAKEMVRATRRGGIIFGFNSEALRYLKRTSEEGRLVREREVPQELKSMTMFTNKPAYIFEKL